MKTILLMRHAKSSWEDKNQEDWQRPLSKRGRKNAQQMGELLHDEKLIPDLVLASFAVRARQTADIVMDALRYQGNFCSLNKLFMAEIEGYVQEIQKIPDTVNSVLIIGHNPSLDSILQMMTGKVQSLPTSALANLTTPIDSWKDFTLDLQSELVRLWRPKDL